MVDDGKWPYHEDPHGNMVRCASNPCSRHSDSEHFMASSEEEATGLRYGNSVVGMTEWMDDPDIAREDYRKRVIDAVPDDIPDTDANMRTLARIADEVTMHGQGDSSVSGYAMIPGNEAHDRLRSMGMDEDAINDAMGTIAGSDYVRFNDDGDIEGLTKDDARALLWENRRDILDAAMVDDDLDMGTINEISHMND